MSAPKTPVAVVDTKVAAAILAPEPLLVVFVSGTGKPKGSMRHVGKGRLVEQVSGSGDWRSNVRDAARDAVRCGCDSDCAGIKTGYPYPGAVEAHITVSFNKPASAPKRRRIQPITRSTGDVDKLARNILDAIADAGVIRDDAQVVTLVIGKRYCEGNQVPGAQITVRAVSTQEAT